MLDRIAQSLVDELNDAGISAGRAWPAEDICETGTYVRLSIASAQQSEAGFARFLGLEEQEGADAAELYGMRCRIGLRLDIYAGADNDNAAAECEKTMDGIMLALAGCAGVSISSVSCGETGHDRQTGMFLCRCRAETDTELIFRKTEEEIGEFTDFILKGELER